MDEACYAKNCKDNRKVDKAIIECWNWDEVLTENPICEGLLGRPSHPQGQPVRAHLEITITHPPTTKWLNMMSLEQIKYLSRIWDNIIPVCGMAHVKESGHVFEFHKNGHAHLHGYIILEFDKPFSPYGLVADYAKAVLKQMPKKYINYNDNYMTPEWIRYKCPSVCVQYINDDERPYRITEWISYLKKTGAQICVKNKK